MRSKLIVLTLCVNFLSSAPVVAQTAQPVEREGVSFAIDPAAWKAVEEWAANLKMDADRGIQNAQRLDLSQQESSLRRTLDGLLASSDKNMAEFLSRNVLYRAQDIHNVLLKIPSDPKRNAFARRILKESIIWAQSLAPVDARLVSTSGFQIAKTEERAKFGVQWARFMLLRSFNLPTNEAHVAVLKMIMGYMYNDILQDDQYNRLLAGVARNFAQEYQRLNDIRPANPIEYLELMKQLREFLDQEIKIAEGTLNIPSGVTSVQGTPVKESLTSIRAKLSAIKNLSNLQGNAAIEELVKSQAEGMSPTLLKEILSGIRYVSGNHSNDEQQTLGRSLSVYLTKNVWTLSTQDLKDIWSCDPVMRWGIRIQLNGLLEAYLVGNLSRISEPQLQELLKLLQYVSGNHEFDETQTKNRMVKAWLQAH